MTQTMWVDLKIYYPNEVSVSPADWPWETGDYEDSNKIVYFVRGMRDRKSTRLNSSHTDISRMPSSA